ncbi:L-lactate dehydrogenase [Candidatus Peregrinibacteria bacterium CG_4_9_14_0_2_um_filter_53_11]|nr:MAG: L-lactate dehydrogenase [Candidatus Peregrinibacteria bacterium CG_4_9_14_0_2_um_filter_53_11]
MSSTSLLHTTKAHTFKVSVVGCGNVGATMAYTLLLDGSTTDLALVDINKKKAEALLLDLEHSLSLTSYTHLTADDKPAAVANSNLIIVTAGKRQEEGESRLDLTEANKKIFDSLIPALVKAAPDALILVVTNPVDVLTHHALTLSGLPAGRVFGSGTLLDTVRFQFHLSQRLKVHPRSINAFILGEHGDSSFPVISSANISGKPLTSFPLVTPQLIDECFEETRSAAYRIIHDMGYTCYSIATATRTIVRAIAQDTHEVLMLSTLLDNYYGESDICLSVPCVIGAEGVYETIEVPLNEEEKKKLAESATILRQLAQPEADATAPGFSPTT